MSKPSATMKETVLAASGSTPVFGRSGTSGVGAGGEMTVELDDDDSDSGRDKEEEREEEDREVD